MALTSIIGQSEAKSRLKIALKDTPGHAWLFTGPDGIGKEMLAREFAKALLCHKPSDEGACGSCLSCRYFDNGVHADFRQLSLDDKEKVIKVERVRQDVCADLAYMPQFGSRKVYLIDADALNEQGQNALLKSLEEPPPYVFILMTAIGPERLLPTLLSRTGVVPLRRSKPEEIEMILDMAGFSDHVTRSFYARFAGGLAGAAIDLAGSGWFSDLRQETLQLVRDIGHKSRTFLLTSGYQFFDSNKPHAPVILDIIGSLIRDRLVLLCGGRREWITNQDQMDDLKPGKAGIQPSAETRGPLIRAYAAVLSARRGLSLNVSFEPLICHFLLCLRKELEYA